MFGRRHTFDLIALPAGLLILGLFLWWAIYAGPHRADKIEAQLKAETEKMLSEPDFDWAEIEVSGRNATLSGIAPSTELRDIALARLERVSGTGGVFWGSIRSLTDNTTLSPPVDIYEFSASYHDGTLRLEGVMPGIHGRDRILSFLKQKGFSPDLISDETRFRDGIPDGDWYGMVELGLSQLLALKHGEMDLIDKRLLLTGQSMDDDSRLSIIQKLTLPPSGFTVDADLSGSVVWSASLKHGQLVLHGDVPDAPERTQLAELADRFFDGEIVNNQRIVQMSNRTWVTGVRTALPNFLSFLEGEMTYRGNALLISGRATQSVIDHLQEDIVRVGALVNFQFDVTPALKPLASFTVLKEGEIASPELCLSALNEALSAGSFEFRGRGTTLTRESNRVLDGVETVLMTCPGAVLEISAFTNVNGAYVSGQQLTEGRQRAVSDYFIARGVPLNQIELTDVTSGLEAPVTGEGVPDTGQIRMRLKE